MLLNVSGHSIFNLIALLVGGYMLHLWWSDTQLGLSQSSHSQKDTIPGASLASWSTCIIAAFGAIVLVLILTFLEFWLGVDTDQTTLSWWFLPAMLGAAITEEVVFRGYLVVQTKGPTILMLSVVGFSLLFALLHPYLWTHAVQSPMGIEWITQLRPRLELQPILATSSLFLLSLWFYTVRFWRINPTRSLLPSFCAHAGANLVVFMIKLATGHITG